MANRINESDISGWVDDRMAALSGAPAVQLNGDRIWETLNRRSRQPASRRSGMLRWAAIMVILAFALPVGLTLAQRLFRDPSSQNLPGVDAERIRSAQTVLPWTFTSSGPGRRVASLDEAAPLTGLNADGRRVERPYKALHSLWDVIRRDPLGFFGKAQWMMSLQHGTLRESAWSEERFANPTSIQVTDPATFRLEIKAGVWSGGVINVHFPPAVVADYGGVLIAQSALYTVTTSPQIDMKGFAEFMTGVLGYPEQLAKALNDWTFKKHHVDSAILSPASLVLYPTEGPYIVKNILMGPNEGVFGLLVENTADKPETLRQFAPGPGDLILVFMTDKRMYAIMGPISEDQAIALAYSLR
jgi:hypothetical protein